jgi:hypothetical protein
MIVLSFIFLIMWLFNKLTEDIFCFLNFWILILFMLISIKCLFILSFILFNGFFFYALILLFWKKNINFTKYSKFLSQLGHWIFVLDSEIIYFFFKNGEKRPLFIISQSLTVLTVFINMPFFLMHFLIFILNDLFYHQKLNYYLVFFRCLFYISVTKIFGFSFILLKLTIDFIEFFLKNWSQNKHDLFFFSKILAIFLKIYFTFRKKIYPLTLNLNK